MPSLKKNSLDLQEAVPKVSYCLLGHLICLAPEFARAIAL